LISAKIKLLSMINELASLALLYTLPLKILKLMQHFLKTCTFIGVVYIGLILRFKFNFEVPVASTLKFNVYKCFYFK